MSRPTEKDLLVAELLCGYQYFEAKSTLEQKQKEQQQKLEQLTKAKRERARKVDLTALPIVQEKYNEEIAKRNQACQAEQDRATQNYKYIIKHYESRRKKRSIAWIVFAVAYAIVFAFAIVMDKVPNMPEIMLPIVMGGVNMVGFISMIVAISIANSMKGYTDNYYRAQKELKNLQKSNDVKCDMTIKEFVQDYSFKTYFPDINELYEFIAHSNKFEPLRKAQYYIDNQQLLIDNTENSLKALKKLKNSIVQTLSVIPPFYFKKDSVAQMLLYFINKRSDNITDLVNMYELRDKTDASEDMDRFIQMGLKDLQANLFNCYSWVCSNYNVMFNDNLDMQSVQRIGDKNIYGLMQMKEFINDINNLLQQEKDFVVEDNYVAIPDEYYGEENRKIK